MSSPFDRQLDVAQHAVAATPDELKRLQSSASDHSVTLRPDCDHHWTFHIRGGEPLSVGICTLCGDPNWEDLRRQLSELDGATDRGPFNAYPSTPGEFAARWNSWSSEERSLWLIASVKAFEKAQSCDIRHRPQSMTEEIPDARL